jgi:hypothetical protein
MIRRMSLVVAGIFAGACTACAPAPPPSIGSASGIGTGFLDCNATQFANSVQVLPAPYDPTNLKSPPTGTPLDKTTNPGAWQDLSDAFDSAPPKFKQRLCITSVFVDPYYDQTNPVSWGFRKPNTTERFIGLPGYLWGGGNLTNHAGKYSAYETDLFKRLFKQSIGHEWDMNSAFVGYGQAQSKGLGTSVDVDTSATTVLAILAHEYGHTLFYELFKGNDLASTAMNAQAFCRTPPSATNGYFDNSWASITIPRNYWTDFGAVTDSHAGNLVQIYDIQNEFRASRPNWGNIVAYVGALYWPDNYYVSGRAPSGLWPSLYGAISPIEDFVEGFKLAVLTHPGANNGNPVNSMPIYITTGFTSAAGFDVFADEKKGSKQELHRKKLCIHNSIL